MTRATNKPKKARRQVRFPGIITDAETLGVTRQHLFAVLIGSRPSQKLTDRYRALKAKQAEATKAEVAA